MRRSLRPLGHHRPLSFSHQPMHGGRTLRRQQRHVRRRRHSVVHKEQYLLRELKFSSHRCRHQSPHRQPMASGPQGHPSKRGTARLGIHALEMITTVILRQLQISLVTKRSRLLSSTSTRPPTLVLKGCHFSRTWALGPFSMLSSRLNGHLEFPSLQRVGTNHRLNKVSRLQGRATHGWVRCNGHSPVR